MGAQLREVVGQKKLYLVEKSGGVARHAFVCARATLFSSRETRRNARLEMKDDDDDAASCLILLARLPLSLSVSLILPSGSVAPLAS